MAELKDLILGSNPVCIIARLLVGALIPSWKDYVGVVKKAETSRIRLRVWCALFELCAFKGFLLS